MVIMLFAQVISRYVFSFPVMWSEEMGRYIFIWLSYLGGAFALKEKRHLFVDVLFNKLKYSLRMKMLFIIYFLVLIFLSFVFIYGLQYTKLNWYEFAYSTRFVKVGWAYAAIPVGSLFMIINIIRILAEILKKGSDIKK